MAFVINCGPDKICRVFVDSGAGKFMVVPKFETSRPARHEPVGSSGKPFEDTVELIIGVSSFVHAKVCVRPFDRKTKKKPQ